MAIWRAKPLNFLLWIARHERWLVDIVAFLKLRTAFIRYFYENGVRPFNEIKTAIEKGEEPYVPPYSEDGEPPFLDEWMDAEQAVETVGHACISMLSSSLQLFLKTWVSRLEQELGIKFHLDFKKHGWFNGYKQVFALVEFPLSECTADLDIIEQVTLARNRVQHPDDLTDFRVTHSETDLRRFPRPFFASEVEMNMAVRDEDDSTTWWLRPSIKSERDKILSAIDQAETLCFWLEEEFWKGIDNQRLQRIVEKGVHSR
jgi:hypothetical protein